MEVSCDKCQVNFTLQGSGIRQKYVPCPSCGNNVQIENAMKQNDYFFENEPSGDKTSIVERNSTASGLFDKVEEATQTIYSGHFIPNRKVDIISQVTIPGIPDFHITFRQFDISRRFQVQKRNGKIIGIYSVGQILEMLKSREIDLGAKVTEENTNNWRPVKQIPEISAIVAAGGDIADLNFHSQELDSVDKLQRIKNLKKKVNVKSEHEEDLILSNKKDKQKILIAVVLGLLLLFFLLDTSFNITGLFSASEQVVKNTNHEQTIKIRKEALIDPATQKELPVPNSVPKLSPDGNTKQEYEKVIQNGLAWASTGKADNAQLDKLASVQGMALVHYGPQVAKLPEFESILSSHEKSNDPNFLKAKAAYLIHKNGSQAGLNILDDVLEKNPQDREALLLQGKANIAMGELDKAAENFDQVLMNDIKDAQALQGMGQILMEEKDYPHALQWMQKALEVEPENGMALSKLGQIYQEGLDKSSDAKQIYKQLLQANPPLLDNHEQAVVNAKYGQTLIEEGHPRDSLPYMQKAVELSSDSLQLLQYLADAQKVSGNHSQALDLYKKILRSEPKNIHALLGKGEVYFENGDYVNAKESFEKAETIDPQAVEPKLYGGKLLSAQGQHQKAQKKYRDILDSNPNALHAGLALGTSLVASGKSEDGLEYLQSLRKQNNKDSKVDEALGDAYRYLLDFPESSKYYRSSIAKDPKNIESYNKLADLMVEFEKPEEAGRILQQALQKQPLNVPLINKLGTVYQELGDYDTAAKQHATARELNIEDPQGYYQGIVVELQRKNPDAAKQLYHEVGQKFPDNVDTLYYQAKYDQIAGKKEQALEKLEEANKRSPNNSKYIYELGLLYLLLEDFIQAMSLFKEVIGIEPQNINPYIEIGRGHLEQNNPAGAKEYFQKASELRPYKKKPYLMLGKTYQNNQENNRAIQAYEKVLQIDPQNEEANFQLGSIYIDAGRAEQGLSYLIQAAKKNPNNSEAYLKLGYAYKGAHQQDDAIKAFQKFLELTPASPHAQVVKDEIQNLQ